LRLFAMLRSAITGREQIACWMTSGGDGSYCN
jgi:hypothetical protein